MKRSDVWVRRGAVSALALALPSTAIIAATAATAAGAAVPSVRGFDGKTITVAGLRIKSQLPPHRIAGRNTGWRDAPGGAHR
jgi:hypothetical protein